MKCFECKKEIDKGKGYEVTAPDGDCFHKECLLKYEKERDIFFNDIIHDDKKFANWLGVPESMVNTDS